VDPIKPTYKSVRGEWIEFIIIALLLWLLMVVGITELELNSVTPI
jgi:nitrate reductase NapE component